MTEKESRDLFNFASDKLKNNSSSAKDKIGQNGEKLLEKLSPADREKVTQILNNPEMTKKILASKKAQELMKNLFGEK